MRTVEDRQKLFRETMYTVFRDSDEMGRIMDELADSGYFTAPASTKHHANYEGGLFDHSLNVTNSLLALTDANNLEWMREQSPYIIGMFHDLCKMDAYKENGGYVYNEFTKDIEREWIYNSDTLYKGHGDKSVILASAYLRLMPEEVACIRYHMGAFTEKEEWAYFTRAVQAYPNVLWTHTADMIATHIDEKEWKKDEER